MEIIEKKVSMTELFFDLIFVWATARMTHMLHHLHNGIIEPIEYSKYLITYISWINVWMIQTVFNNRYSDDDIVDQLFTYFNMFLLLLLLNFVNRDFQEVFIIYNRLIVIVTISQICQYIRQFYKRNDQENRELIKSFIFTLLLKAIIIGVGGFLPYDIGVVVVVIGILVAWLYPIIYINRMKKVPINFPNLVERLTLLMIITFGETMLSIASYFQVNSYINTFICFVMVASLFFYYRIVFNDIIEHHNHNATGVGFMYLHYMILIGVSAVTISINALADKEVNNAFVVIFLYLAFLVFYLGIFLNYKYNKKSHQYSMKCIINHFIILVLGGIISFIMRENHTAILGISALVNLFSAINIWRFSKNCILTKVKK